MSTSERAAGSVGNFLDERVGASKGVKFLFRKIFPDHWSFMLGEVALYSFIILLLTGTFLSFFYVPSAAHTTYNGVYAPLGNQQVSEAYASTLALSFDVTQNCKVVFGPAKRPLPQLAITVDAEGYLVAKEGFREAVGPSFWERG